MSPEDLIGCALAAREHAYSPYSRYAVGAAVEAANGQAYGGCNVENASYGLTMCAERMAAFAAVCAGQCSGWRAVAVVTPDGSPPCGACRQVLAEFAGDDLMLYLARPDGTYAVCTLGDLFPHPFRLT